MNDAEGLQKSRAGHFKLGRTGGSLRRCRGGSTEGSRERGWAAGFKCWYGQGGRGATAAGGRRGAACGLATSTRPRAGREPPLREVRGSTLGAGTLHLTDWESGRAGTGRGPIVDRRPSSSGRKAWGRPCGGRGSLRPVRQL